MSLPPDSPMDASWTEPADTRTQASMYRPLHKEPAGQGQIGEDPSVSAAGHFVMAAPFEDQTGTSPIETTPDVFPQDFSCTTIGEEIANDGFTPNTRPFGTGNPTAGPTPGTRGLTPEVR